MKEHVELLGRKATDAVSGFSGVITSISFDLYGCVQAIVTPTTLDKEGRRVSGEWFDVNRLHVAKDDRVLPLPTFPSIAAHVHGPAEKPVK